MATKPRDRALGFAIVIAVIALIWWGGSTIRGCFESGSATTQDGGSDGGDAASATAVAASAAASSAAPIASAAPVDAAVDAGPPRSPACQAMHDASEKVIAAARASSSCVVPPDVDRLGCTTTAKSTWGFRLDALQEIAPKLEGDSCASFGGLVNLVRVDAAGAETAEIPNLFLFKKDAGGDSGAFYKYNFANGRFAIAITDTKFFDWDGDGESEVWVATRIGSTDAEEQSEGSILSWQGGKIAPYPNAADLAIDAVEDVDADGRPDLILRTWKTRVTDSAHPGALPATSVRAVAHSLPDGTFSKKDAAAVAYVQKQCPTAPKLEGLAGGTLTDGDVIACALFWAVPAAKLEPLVAKAPPWTRELLKEKPPFVLK
jgi:hypothetical protein